MATTYTRDDLAVRVLRDLGLIASDETPSASDMDWSRETISSEVAMMAQINLPIWNGSDMAVPLEYLTILSRRIGLALAPSFGMSDVATATLAMKQVEQTLYAMASASPSGLTATADYF